MRLLLFTFLFLKLFSVTAQPAQGILEGVVRDSTTVDYLELIGVSVKVTQNGALVKGVLTDVNGVYRIPLDPGVYDVEFSYTGYNVFFINKITIMPAQTIRQNASLKERMGCGITYWPWPPLVDQSPGNSGTIFSGQMLRHIY